MVRSILWPHYYGNDGITKLITGTLAVALSHPFEVLRVRAQGGQAGQFGGMSFIDIAKRTLEKEGPAGFFKGILPRSIFLLPIILGLQSMDSDLPGTEEWGADKSAL